MELFRFASPDVHFDDTGNRAEFHPDVPFQDRSERHRTISGSGHRELIDFAEAGGQGTHDRTAILRRDALDRLGQSFGDQLSRSVDVRAVVEDGGHGREAVP